MSACVLVTGASTGIGRATVMELAQQGFTVFAGVRKSADGEHLRAAASGVVPVLLDVTDADQIAVAVETITEREGRLDGLVNNAGIGVTGPVEFVPLPDLRRSFEVNVVGQIAVTQALLPLLRTSQGRIVNIGSIGDRMAVPFGGPLCSSKFSVLALNDALRMELKPWGVQVSLVEPASIKTDAVDKLERDAETTLAAIDERGRTLYGKRYRSMIAAFARSERDGSDPAVVGRVVARALTVRRPKPRYLVGKGSTPMSLMARFLPQRTLDSLRMRMFGVSD